MSFWESFNDHMITEWWEPPLYFVILVVGFLLVMLLIYGVLDQIIYPIIYRTQRREMRERWEQDGYL